MTDVLADNTEKEPNAADGRFFDTQSPTEVTHAAQEAVGFDHLKAVSQAARRTLSEITPEQWAQHRIDLTALVHGDGDPGLISRVGAIEQLLADAAMYQDVLSAARHEIGGCCVRNF